MYALLPFYPERGEKLVPHFSASYRIQTNFLILIFCVFFQSFSPNVLPATEAETSATQTRQPLIERGASIPPLDLLASVLALPTKLILWDWRYCNHNISEKTEEALADYVRRNNLYDVKFRLNQWSPFDEMRRLFKNREVGLPYRLIAIPTTFLYSAVGRLLGGLLLSDYYDPYSHTVHIFSDDIAIALHEAGHAKDFSYRKWRGTYSLARLLPGFDTYQESLATDEALDYLKITGQRSEAVRAYKILYPAYASYVGGYLPAYPIGYLGAILGGHIYGRWKANELEQEFKIQDERKKFRQIDQQRGQSL